MAQEKIKVYTASSVGIDYFFFLTRTISSDKFEAEPLYLISEQEYRNLAKSGGFKKLWLRIKMYILYPLFLIYKGLGCRRESIFVVSSNTFFAPYLVHLFLKFKKIRVVHMLYDLFPDAIEIAGAIKTNGIWSKAIGKITKLNQKKCEATIYLGSFLQQHAELRWGEARKSKVIDISTDLSLYSSNQTSLIDTKKIIIHYGGQLGHLHDASSIIEAIKYVCSSDLKDIIEFNFYVSGAQAAFLEKSLKEYPIKIISAIPSHVWREDVRNFHIGLVSLSPGGASVCLPSKTYGMMASGMAILAICPSWSDLGTLIRNANAGWIVNNSNFDTKEDLFSGNYASNLLSKRPKDLIANNFYNVIKEVSDNRELLELARKNAFNSVRDNYNIINLNKKWTEILENI